MAVSDLHKYPRPSVAVDVALLTVDEGRLKVALIRRESGDKSGELSLPGTFVHEGELLVDAALRSLADKAGVCGFHPRQLHVFDDPKRDDRGWVLSVAHVDVARVEDLREAVERENIQLVDVELIGNLPYAHDEIVRKAVDAVRRSYLENPDPWGLIEQPFVLSQLRDLHESVLGHQLQRDTFRRQMEPMLQGTEETAVPPPARVGGEARGRPARLYRHN
ncbi:NUDIX hydrolase [Paeniglutamicibacter gangotriensis]|uniref:NUDIX hydrolase n=1 Tax=Paeniglutamicibacter gangotriensis TaxID=254787 RepID=A0A5B0E5A4_9MICC|nr:NUDIX domain-containing protein [Paeniglutamicibacter gangotriensis]KAA0974154.1 NUDIX hydrolase [Paeniglutamicibacter gangotriensis]